jgi:hypothetical protein
MEALGKEGSDNQLLGLADAPEVLVEGYRGVMLRAGVLKLNFFASRFDPATERTDKHAAVTLAIPLADFVDVATALNALLNDMREKGALPKEEPT